MKIQRGTCGVNISKVSYTIQDDLLNIYMESYQAHVIVERFQTRINQMSRSLANAYAFVEINRISRMCY